MLAGNNREVALILKQYKHKSGEINYPAIFGGIPSSERLPAMYEKDFMQATALLVGALAVAFKRMQVKRATGDMVNDIAEEILLSCDEDNLALEDVVLFLQDMIRGKYGNVDDLTTPKFMKLFDGYRNERHLAMMDLRENEHLSFRGIGDASRSTKSDELSEHLGNISGRLVEMKDALREKTKENQKLKDIDKF